MGGGTGSGEGRVLVRAEQGAVAREENLQGALEPRSPRTLCRAVPPGLPGPRERLWPCTAPQLPAELQRCRWGHHSWLQGGHPCARRMHSALGPPCARSYMLFFIALSCSSTPGCFPALGSPPPLAAARGCCEITFQKMEQTRLQQRDFKWAGKPVAALHKGDGAQSIIGSPHPAHCIFNGSLGLNV